MERTKQGQLRQASLQLAGRPFRVILGTSPRHQFYLYDQDRRYDPSWYGASFLKSYHPVDNTFYQFTLVEKGEKVAARPYSGDFGTLKLDPGRLPLEKVGFEGAVYREGGGLAPIKSFGEDSFRLGTEYRIPVGNYRPHSLTVIYDNLRFSVVGNYFPISRERTRRHEPDYPLEVNSERPCVLEFSDKPRVVFLQPSADRLLFSPGQKITFASELIDPNLDIMIRDLSSISAPKHKPDFPRQFWDRERLHPEIVIARADGSVLAEGVMPFG